MPPGTAPSPIEGRAPDGTDYFVDTTNDVLGVFPPTPTGLGETPGVTLVNWHPAEWMVDGLSNGAGVFTLGSDWTLTMHPLNEYWDDHERAHREQAQELGLGYLPGYLNELVQLMWEYRASAGDAWPYHSYERDAEIRAGHSDPAPADAPPLVRPGTTP
jgi:hypothetical protein